MALEEPDTTETEQPGTGWPRRTADPRVMPAEAQPEPQPQPAARPGQQQADPNAPGGGPPDPSSFRLSPTNPSRGLQTAMATPLNPTTSDAQPWNTRPFGPNVYRPPGGGGPSQWGKPWWPLTTSMSYAGPDIGNPNLPNPLESYPLSTKASKELATHSPDDVAKPLMQGNLLMTPIAMIADLFSKGMFSQNFSQSYLRGLAIQREEALQHWEQALDIYRQRILSYGTIISALSASKDPNRFAFAKQQMEEAAARDPVVLNLLHNGGFPAVEQFLNNQHSWMLQLQSAASQIKKTTTQKEREEADESAAMGLPHSPGGIAEGMHFPNLEEGKPREKPGEIRTPTRDESTPEKAAGGPREREVSEDPFLEYLKQQTPLATPQTLDAARKRYMGGDPKMIPHSPADRAVEQITRALDTQVKRTAAYKDPGKPPDDPKVSQGKQDAINTIVPGLGDRIGQLHSLAVDPKSVTMKGDERFNIMTLTGQVWPGWNEGMYHNYWNVWKNENGSMGQRLLALNRSSSAAERALAAVNNLPIDEGDPFPITLYHDIIDGKLGNNPRYNAVIDLVGTFAREQIATQGQRGGAVAYVKQMMEGFNPAQGKAGFRNMIRSSIGSNQNVVDDLMTQFHKDTGLPAEMMPTYSERAKAVNENIIMGNPFFGTFHKDAPEELLQIQPKILDPEGKYRKKKPSWLDKNMIWEPMSKKEFDMRNKYIKDHPDDPLADTFRHELGIRR